VNHHSVAASSVVKAKDAAVSGPLDTAESCDWTTTTLLVDQRDRLAFDVFIFVFIYVIPGAVVLISYSLTGSRLLTSDESLRRQQSPGGADDQTPRRRRRRRWRNLTSDIAERGGRHASSQVRARPSALLDNSRICQLADWTSRGLTTRGRHRRLCVLKVVTHYKVFF